MSRKEFIAKASLLKVGEKIMIKKAAGWERFKGWHDYYWYKCIFESFDGKELILFDKFNARKFYITYRKLKVGEYQVVWGQYDVFTKNLPTNLEKNNEIPMWDKGKLDIYK